jgi:hypothetical protein
MAKAPKQETEKVVEVKKKKKRTVVIVTDSESDSDSDISLDVPVKKPHPKEPEKREDFGRSRQNRNSVVKQPTGAQQPAVDYKKFFCN